MEYSKYFLCGFILSTVEIITFAISMRPADPNNPTIKDFFYGILTFYLINTVGIVFLDRFL